MRVYGSYNNTGTSHQVEYALTSKGWFWRWQLAPHEWKGPLTKMKGTEDGNGQMWATFEGEGTDGKKFELSLRLVPIEKARRWDHAGYPPDPAKAKDSPVQRDTDNKALPPPGAVPESKQTLTMSDLLVLDGPDPAK